MLPRRASPPTRAHQTNLLDVAGGPKSNMVLLYDLSPRFAFIPDPSDAGKLILERDFTFAGGRYRITSKPTRIKQPDGTELYRYLGEREQIVEEVIRRLACNRNRLTLETSIIQGDAMAHEKFSDCFAFSIYEVRKELERVKHGYSYQQVVEAIQVLNEVRITIHDLDAKGAPLLSASAFPVLGMRRTGDVDAEMFVEFNPLVAQAIRSLSFQQFDYETLMRLRNPTARWLYKRLHVSIAATRQNVQRLSANDIRRDSGMAEWKKTRGNYARIAEAMNSLVKHGVLDGVKAVPVMQGRKKVDVTFTVCATPEFNAQVLGSNHALA